MISASLLAFALDYHEPLALAFFVESSAGLDVGTSIGPRPTFRRAVASARNLLNLRETFAGPLNPYESLDLLWDVWNLVGLATSRTKGRGTVGNL